MGKILVIGVTCADVVINVDRLPKTAEDVLVYGQHMALGGCAFNAYAIMHALGEPAVLFSPIGGGAYGDFVREHLAAEGIESPIPDAPGDNGCCYCFVEPGGERTFVAYHGADYLYRAEWFDRIDVDDVDMVYVCGLEVEEPTGEAIVEFLERTCADKTIFFTPGPRADSLPQDLVERIYALHPIMHLNDTEVEVSARRIADPELVRARGAAAILAERTGNMVLVTLGGEGCYYKAGPQQGVVPGVRTQVVDTIGAGDSHIGAVMACLHRGLSLEESLACANRIAAAVVATSGAHLPAETVRAAAHILTEA